MSLQHGSLGVATNSSLGNASNVVTLEVNDPVNGGLVFLNGGVTIPHDTGLIGHSDADVLCHAITDAVLGAAALGDIGRHFPDTDERFRGADSVVLLTEAAAP